MKLLVTSPTGRTSLVDFTELFRTHKALHEFCKENADKEGTYHYDASQGSHEDDIAFCADTLAEELQELLEKPEIPENIRNMSRELAVAILEKYGFACHDNESLEDLHEAIRVNIADGTIPQEGAASG